MLHNEALGGGSSRDDWDMGQVVNRRKQISMVLPASLISAIKQRAARRGQSITAYITCLVEQDLTAAEGSNGEARARTLVERLEELELRVNKLEPPVL